MGLFTKKSKRVEPLIRIVIDFDDYDDPEAEINPYGPRGQWEIGSPNVVSVERADGLHEITHLEYVNDEEPEPHKPGELGVLPDLYDRRFVTSKTTAEWVSEFINEVGVFHFIDDLDEFCDVSNLERVVLIGRMWTSTYNTPNDGWDFDCGFDVEAVEEIIVR